MEKVTQSTPVAVVAIDEDPKTLDSVSQALSDSAINLHLIGDLATALELIQKYRPRIVLLGSKVSSDGNRILQQLMERDPGMDVVLMTESYSAEVAIDTIQNGACDCIPKPFSADRLRELVNNLVNATLARRRTLELDRELMEAFRFEGMVGRSPLMLDLYGKIARVARHFRTVLITGPTGSGKELVARAIHARSPVHDHAFVAVNCAAIAESLAESQLFGHLRGAFTGANHDQAGIFEYANGGTVFLDEIGDMALGMQAKLLRVIQNQEITRIGSPAVRKVDVRVVAATNRDLRGLMKKHLFREDLYYRLATVHFKLPTLAERKEDLPILQREFVERASAHCGKHIRGITRRAQTELNRYSWPGNVRELESVLNHACMMADAEFVDVGDLPDYLLECVRGEASADTLLSLDEMSRQYARRVVSQLSGNKLKAAEVLGISRATLYRLLSSTKHEVDSSFTVPDSIGPATPDSLPTLP